MKGANMSFILRFISVLCSNDMRNGLPIMMFDSYTCNTEQVLIMQFAKMISTAKLNADKSRHFSRHIGGYLQFSALHTAA